MGVGEIAQDIRISWFLEFLFSVVILSAAKVLGGRSDDWRQARKALTFSEVPVQVAGSRGPSTPQTPVGMTQRKIMQEKDGRGEIAAT
jgi:hypothetical protein